MGPSAGGRTSGGPAIVVGVSAITVMVTSVSGVSHAGSRLCRALSSGPSGSFEGRVVASAAALGGHGGGTTRDSITTGSGRRASIA